MSAPAFTPGPWHVETIDDGENDGVPIYGVCHAGTVCDATTVCNVLVEGDAYLTAAAPELYYALQIVTDAFADCYIESAAVDGDTRIQNARAALAKARGESPSTHQDRT